MSKQSFESRAAELLANPAAASDDIEAMTRECEREIAFAEHEAARLKAASLDPALAPDPGAAMEAAQLAEIMEVRCRALRRQLEQKWRTALSEEYRQKWAARHQAARARRDAASAKFSRVRDLLAELVGIFQEAEAADQLVAQANSDAPAGVSSRLLSVECHARGLEEGFTRDRPSLMKEMRLLDFDSKQIWPVAQRVDPALFTMDGRRFADDCSPTWWKRGAAEAEAKAERDQQSIAAAEVARDRFYGRGAG